ncbi:MAG: DUF1559 domain-containing protein [Pirellulaceae bacterium]
MRLLSAAVGGGELRVNYDFRFEEQDSRSSNFSSFHPGGTQFALADGSVTFISETIDFTGVDQVLTNNGPTNTFCVYQKLLSRDDGQPVAVP